MFEIALTASLYFSATPARVVETYARELTLLGWSLSNEPMTHQEAIRLEAAEKYHLRELSPDQRDAFEAHYFECSECAADVAALQTLIDTLREDRPVPARPTVPPPARRWLAPVSMAFAAALACAVFYQSAVAIPRLQAELEQPRLLVNLPPGARTRSATSGTEFRVPLQFPPGFASYQVVVRGPSGAVVPPLEVAGSQELPDSLGLRRSSRVQGDLQLILYGLNPGLRPVELSKTNIYIP